MVYIRDGQVVEKRSPWRASIFAEVFLAIINFIVIFFQTIFDPAAASAMRSGRGSSSSSSNNNNRRPGGGGRGGGGGGGGRIVGMDNLKADHSARCGGGG